jgi:excisionase family DNA binding protein
MAATKKTTRRVEAQTPPYMSLADAQVYSTLSETTLRRAIARDELHVLRRGGRVVITREALDEYLRGDN